MEGILELDLEGGRGLPQRKVSSSSARVSSAAAATANGGGGKKNLSPNLLRRRIEQLKEVEER